MKKYSSILAMLLLLALINGCKKDDKVEPPITYTRFPEPLWMEDQAGKYPLSMTAVVAIPQRMRASMVPGDKLGAFVNNECRGQGTIIKVNEALSVFYVLIHGTASEQVKVKFIYYCKSNSYMYATPEFLNFTVDGNFGTPDSPEVIALEQLK